MLNAKAELKGLVKQAANIVAFTGAGISTECGIPDFRSPGGFWSKNKPIMFDEFVKNPQARIQGWSRFLKLKEQFSGVKPGRGHQTIAHLAKTGRLSHVITQNIDNLHQDSGIPPDQVIELHGNGTYARCIECGHRHELDWCGEKFEETGNCPLCQTCGGFVKSATISFGQAMPAVEMQRAEAAAVASDLFLAIGSSLVVYPAAGIPLLARKNGCKLVIINREATELDRYADIVINDDIGDVLEPLGCL